MSEGKKAWKSWLPATLTLLIAFYSATTCKPHAIIVPVGEARVIAKLASGNFEVTPAFILWAMDLKDKISLLELKIKLLEERLDRVIK